MPFKALWITEKPDLKIERSIVSRQLEDLPAGEVLIRVHYSSLNYKDAMSATGNKGITKKYPHTPGIDAAGIVEMSKNPQFAADDEVIVTGYDLGMNTSGGFAEYIRVPAEWVVPRPRSLNLRECMILGTAGFTAATALFKMQAMHQNPAMGPIVVTGSTGGVGSIAVAILARAGYEVIAVTGKSNAEEYLKHLGAARVESRAFVEDQSGKALLKPRWAGAIDTVGGATLNVLLKACSSEGTIVSTGIVQSHALTTTIYPFILNGINLAGVGSAGMKMVQRTAIWKMLEEEWNIKDKFQAIVKELKLEDLTANYIETMLEGKNMGRIIVKI
ncbi:MAG TPA: YhdH/YhfP family quinone oxidoreductase [Flavitalea sp.]|nr:YhdH/YhfP family quinone oxidoreductase [Flavitalea sp.]